MQSNCGSTASGWSGSDFAATTGTAPCDSSISNLQIFQIPSGNEIYWDAIGDAVQWKVQIDQNTPTVIASTFYFPSGLAIGQHTVSITPICTNGAAGAKSTLMFTINGQPDISLVSKGTNGNKTVQVFQIGPNVSAGNVFNAGVYSHEVTITAVSGDTPTSIALKLANAVNATTAAQWNSAGTAPASGTPGFPPSATASGNQITITLDNVHQFGAGASIS